MNDSPISEQATLPELSDTPPARIFTTWGTVLYVDAETGQLRHGAIDTSPENAVFVADPASTGTHRQGRLMHVTGDGFQPIACGALSCRAVSATGGGDPPLAPTLLELLPLERGLIAFHAGGHFLCAQPDGRVDLSKPWCSTWECFVASEDWCAADGAESGNAVEASVNRRGIADIIVDARLRAKANATSKATKILIYGYPAWSHGRVYYDICKHLHRKGYIVDIINWQVNHASYIGELIAFYDLALTALDGVRTLIEVYKVPAERIIGLSHHALDIRVLIDQMGTGIFDRLAGYGAVGYQLFDASVVLGVKRPPNVVHLGVNFDELSAEIPEHLTTVGYAGAFSQHSADGIELKRGELAEEAAREAGLIFKVAGSTANQISFHDMPLFYESVDAVLVSSVTEGAGLPAREGAAAGRLVISTPVGDFPLRASLGLGIVAPIEGHKYKQFVAETLKYYRDNPVDFARMCRKGQDAAQQLDWSNMIGDWIELIETAKHDVTTPGILAKGRSATLGEIHLINLDRSPERLETFRANNPHLPNILRVSAVDGSSLNKHELYEDGLITDDMPYPPGTLGCALSHISLWKKAVSQDRVITIFEDDVICSFHFFEKTEEYLSRVPNDWELIQWGYNFYPSFLWLDWDVAKVKLSSYDHRFFGTDLEKFQPGNFSHSAIKLIHSIGTYAYSVSPRGAKALLEYCLPLRRRVIPFPGTEVRIDDGGIDCAMCGAYGSMKAFICIPPLVLFDDRVPSDRLQTDLVEGRL